MIPLYSSDDVFLRHIDADLHPDLRAHVRVVRNRRGNATRAYFKGLSADYLHAHEKRRGQCFEQNLPAIGGKCFALRGVHGS